MNTIYDIADYYDRDPTKWLYYRNYIRHDWPSIREALNDKDSALDFIKSYFHIAGKEKAISDIAKDLKNIDKSRLIHIISTFFLGLRIAECFGIIIEKRDERNLSFSYRWFLTCLYHDIGYIFENNSAEYLKNRTPFGLNKARVMLKIKYMCDCEFKTYSKEHVDIYLRGRATDETVDHGILGGMLLYDRLRKQYEEAWQKRTDKNADQNDFCLLVEGNLLHYSSDHFENYAEAADAIIAHNIFGDTLRQYIAKDIRLTTEVKACLINSACLKNSINMENQLCFILCVADTLEPYKRFKNHECFDKIRFSFYAPTRSVYVHVIDETGLEQVALDKYRDAIQTLGSWLSLNVVSSYAISPKEV